MHTYRVEVTREGKWWLITVPELAGYRTSDGSVNLSDTTQTRRLSAAARQARDFICSVTDTAPSEVAMDITVTVGGVDVTTRGRRYSRRPGTRRPTRRGRAGTGNPLGARSGRTRRSRP